jgi:hypothetical protein
VASTQGREARLDSCLTSLKLTKNDDTNIWMVVQIMDIMKAVSWLGASIAAACST